MGALDGVTVLDLSRVLAGPFCTQTLSDLGATVWKIESPWGDDTRRWGPPFTDGESAYFLSTNRGKKSIIANLRDERGRRIVQRLAEKADVLVENFKVGDLARYGLDYETLSATNPRLIYASITGYGQQGPRAPEPGYDAALQGLTGIMSVTGEADGPPMRVGVAWIDLLTGMTATVGILAALNERNTSGLGQYIDVSLFDVGLASMVNIAQAYLATGVSPMRMGTAHPQIVPYQSFEASDGPFFLAVGNDDQYRRLVEAIGHDELWHDERYRTNEGRVGHRDELIPKLTDIFSGGSRKTWLGLAESAGVPSSPIYTVGEGLSDPHADERGAVWNVPHPKLGSVPLVASALRHMGRTPATPRSHPPMLGEHTFEVLREALDIEESELQQLQKEGVISPD